MHSLIHIIFPFIVIPLCLALGFLEKNSRRTMLFLILGITICLVAAEVNSFVLGRVNLSMFDYTCNVSPIIEELLKALPLMALFFVLKKCPPLDQSISLGLAVGVGFALFENIVVYCQNNLEGTFIWAVSRGIGAGLMHALCTGAVAAGCYFIYHHRYGANFLLMGVLIGAIIYHGLYNCMVQSPLLVGVGMFLPLTTYALLAFLYIKIYRKKKKE